MSRYCLLAFVFGALTAVVVLPVRRARHQVRQEGLQASAPPAAAPLQQRRHRRGGQAQAAHRLQIPERLEVRSVWILQVGAALGARSLKNNDSPPAGISVSSLSDGLFVLHVPSDDNKQKVQLKSLQTNPFSICKV